MDLSVHIPLLHDTKEQPSQQPDLHSGGSLNRLNDYDNDAIPPDFEIAKKHGRANRVYKSRENHHKECDGEEHDVCPCCGNVSHGENVPITCRESDIYHLGSGYPLYFNFLKHTGLILMVIFLISGAFGLITNLQGDDCSSSDTTTFCTDGPIIDMSLANKRNDNHLLTVQVALNLALVILVAGVFHLLRYHLRRVAIDADDKVITPSDYTIKVSGLPKDVTEAEIKDYIEGLSEPGQPVVCAKITRASNIIGHEEFGSKKHAMLKRIKSAHGSGTQIALTQELQDLEDKWNQKLSEQKDQYTNKAYVSLVHAQMADFLIKKFKKSHIKSLLKKVIQSKGFNYFRDNQIKVKRAPEPNDILWENLGYKKAHKYKSRLITVVSTIGILALSFFAILGLYYVQDIATKKNAPGSLILTLIYYGISVLICVINIILSAAIRELAKYEKWGTKTDYLTAIAKKQSLALLFNTAFTSLLVQIAIGAWNSDGGIISTIEALNIYGDNGLIQSMFSVFVINAIFTPINDIIDPSRFYQYYLQRKAIKEGNEANMTQGEANKLFEGTESDLSLKYSSLIKTILLTCFYAPAMPIAIIITVFGLVLTYWVDKYLLLRRNALPPSIGQQLSAAMIEYLEWMAFTFSAGNIMFLFTLVNSEDQRVGRELYNVLVWLTFGLSMVHIFLPMDRINEKLFPIVDLVTEDQTFDEARLGFGTDYDIQNPMTRDDAIQKFVNLNHVHQHERRDSKSVRKLLTMNKSLKGSLQSMIQGLIEDAAVEQDQEKKVKPKQVNETHHTVEVSNSTGADEAQY